AIILRSLLWNDQIRSAAADQLCWLDDCAYDCRSRTPRFLASRVSPLIAACKSFASVGKVMSLGCTVVSTWTRAQSFVRRAPPPYAPRRLSARRSSSVPPRRLRQWLRSEQLVRKLVLQELLSGEVLKVLLAPNGTKSGLGCHRWPASILAPVFFRLCGGASRPPRRGARGRGRA